MTNIVYGYKYVGTPFSVEIEAIKNKPGTWDSSKFSIFRDNILIGEYIRNYHGDHLTFHPFQVGGEWYALYSAEYTCTRVMKLNETSIEDWCGETPAENGFCPTEYYIPRYHKYNVDDNYEYVILNGSEYKTLDEFEDDTIGSVETGFMNFGFLSGCIWGDDSSWKIRYIDLSDVLNKSLTITEKFGYFEMPHGFKLRECVNLNAWEADNQVIKLLKEDVYITNNA